MVQVVCSGARAVSPWALAEAEASREKQSPGSRSGHWVRASPEPAVGSQPWELRGPPLTVLFFCPQQKWTEVAQDCTKAVELNPKYVKALFRRAKAHEKLDNKKECLEGEWLMLCILKSGISSAALESFGDGTFWKCFVLTSVATVIQNYVFKTIHSFCKYLFFPCQKKPIHISQALICLHLK